MPYEGYGLFFYIAQVLRKRDDMIDMHARNACGSTFHANAPS